MTSYKVLFFIRKEKEDKSKKLCPLYLRISCNKRTEISLNKWIQPEKWNPQRQCIVGNTAEARAINDFIKAVEVKLHNIHTSLLNKGELISAETLKMHYLGKAENQKTVLDAFNYQLKIIESQLEQTYTSSTLKKYQICKKHLENFIWNDFKKNDLFLSNINLQFIEEFQRYLINEIQFIDKGGKIIKKKANSHRRTIRYCFLTTDKSRFRISVFVYDNILVGDTVTISSSRITSTVQKLTYLSNGHIQTSWGNIMHVNGSSFGLLGNTLALIIWMLLYDFLKLLPSRTNITVFLCLTTLGFLIVYIFAIMPD